MKHWHYPRWIANRGAGTLAPENTLAALRNGAEYGHRMFECHANPSEQAAVLPMHDDTLNPTNHGHGL